jgi:Mce-associated membrane protein
VLVAMSVKTSMASAPPDQEPRRWRMRLTVDKTGDGAKVSNVQFVP